MQSGVNRGQQEEGVNEARAGSLSLDGWAVGVGGPGQISNAHKLGAFCFLAANCAFPSLCT